MPQKSEERPTLSPRLQPVWGFVKFRYLVLATLGFIVFIDDDLDLDWKTTEEYDEANEHRRASLSKIINKAAVIETADWDNSSEHRTVHYKRQIGEAMARALEGNDEQAEEMLKVAEQRRQEELKRRVDAVEEQVKVKDRWFQCRRMWTAIHYGIGIAALFFSSIAAAKTETLGVSASVAAWCAWLTVFCTALLTFFSAERKSNRYARVWSILNTNLPVIALTIRSNSKMYLKPIIKARTSSSKQTQVSEPDHKFFPMPAPAPVRAAGTLHVPERKCVPCVVFHTGMSRNKESK
jgi:hypothetical protein